MTVTINKGDIIPDQLTAPDDLVNVGRAIKHVVGVVGAKHPGRVFLRLAHHAVVIEQRPQFRYRDGEVSTKDILAIKIKHCRTGRAVQKTLTAHVPRCVPGVLVLLGVLDQSAKKFRVDTFEVLTDKNINPSGQKLYGIRCFPQSIVDNFKHMGGNGGRRQTLSQ